MFEHKKIHEKVLIVHPVFSTIKGAGSASTSLSAQDAMEEAEGLAAAIRLDIVQTMAVNVSRVSPGYLLGKGTRENLAIVVKDYEPHIVFINHTLSPVQQRNLEKELKAKVIDRTGLILEIFGERAQTKEGRIQVELASLEYQKSRLVRSWTHLERQRGGAGFMGGPGESQLEIDRRLIADKISGLKKELVKVRKTRDLGRQARERVPFPVVALVGYTNAGKSTLFNRLTGAQVFAKDLLFATLDPTMRRIELPSGREVILSDTVGFISDLPTHLVEAFRATLDQLQHADVILHVRDSAQENYEAHRQDVVDIMDNLGIEYEQDPRVFEVINKIDICPHERLSDIQRAQNFDDKVIALSAQTGDGVGVLLQAVDGFLSRHHHLVRYSIPSHEGKALAWLYQHAEIRERKEQEGGDKLELLVHISEENQNRFEGLFPYAPY